MSLLRELPLALRRWDANQLSGDHGPSPCGVAAGVGTCG